MFGLENTPEQDSAVLVAAPEEVVAGNEGDAHELLTHALDEVAVEPKPSFGSRVRGFFGKKTSSYEVEEVPNAVSDAASTEEEADQPKRRSLFSRGKGNDKTVDANPPRNGKRTKGKGLPLGVDIGDAGFGVVAASLVNGEYYIDDAQWLPFDTPLDEANRDAAVRSLAALLDRMDTKERRCILGISGVDVTYKRLDVPAKANRTETAGIASISADKAVIYPAVERAQSLESLGKNQYLLSVARKKLVTQIADIARGAGLRPIAVDPSWCAWQRALPQANAVLDLRAARPILSVFPQIIEKKLDVGMTRSLSDDLSDYDISLKIGQAFLEMRRDKGFIFSSLAVVAAPDRYAAIEKALHDIGGLSVSPVTVAGRTDASWTLAMGLSEWSLPDAGVGTTLRTNLLLERADTVGFFGTRVPEQVLRQAVLGIVCIMLLVCGVLGTQYLRYQTVTTQETQVVADDAQLAPRVAQAHQLAVEISSLNAMLNQIATVRASGDTDAVTIAKLGAQLRGNKHVWLNTLTFDSANGWDVTGGSRSMPDLGSTATAVNKTSIFKLLTATSTPSNGLAYHAQIPYVAPDSTVTAPAPATPPLTAAAPAASPATVQGTHQP